MANVEGLDDDMCLNNIRGSWGCNGFFMGFPLCLVWVILMAFSWVIHGMTCSSVRRLYPLQHYDGTIHDNIKHETR
jgi:hypothetical protein